MHNLRGGGFEKASLFSCEIDGLKKGFKIYVEVFGVCK